MDYFLTILTFILIFIILSESYNLVLGYAGMVHVGHVGFMAIGAYASALLTLGGFPFWSGLILGIGAAALAGLVLGIPTIRVRDDYLVAATLGMGEIIRLILLNERHATGGSSGLTKITPPELFGITFQNNWALLFLVLAITLITLAIIHRLISSPFGKVLESIREDEIAASCLGFPVALKKLQILVIGAAIAGLSGVLYAHTIQFIDPEMFNIERMLFVFLIVVFGGKGTFLGPIIGTVILYSLFESLIFLPFPPRFMGPLRWMLYAAVFIAILIVKPTGLLGQKMRKKKL